MVASTIHGVYGLAWSPDGRYVASSFANSIRVWDTTEKQGQEMVQSLIGHEGSVTCLAWAPDGNAIVSAAKDSTVRLWSVTDGTQIFLYDHHERLDLNGASFSYDGRLLASSAWNDRWIHLWRRDNGDLKATVDKSDADDCYALDFHPAKPVLATSSRLRNKITIWEMDMALLLT